MKCRIPVLFFIFSLLMINTLPGQSTSDSETSESQIKIACDDSTWATIKKSRNIVVYNEFLATCPDSRWAVLAKHLMKSLELDEAQKNKKRVSLSTKHDVDW